MAGILLVLFAPGYALTLALFPDRPNDGANNTEPSGRFVIRIEQCAWIMGLSLGLAVLGALLLHLLPGGLTRASWLILLGCTTAVAGAVAWIRQRPSAAAVLAAKGQHRLGKRRAVAFIAAGLISASALWLAHSSEDSVPHPGFAQLWLVSQAAIREATTTAELGVHSYEEVDRPFRLVLRNDGTVVNTWSFVLRPGEVWQQRVDMPVGYSLEAQLYRDRDQTPYRRVTLQPR